MAYTADMAAPALKWVAVTPSNTVNLPLGVRALWVNGAGDLSLVGEDNVAVVFTVPIGQEGRVLPLGAKRVNATGTTATGIRALY